MPSLDALPGLSAVDVRRIDHSVDRQAILGAAAGFVLGTIALTPAPLVTTAAHRLAGWPWGQVAAAAYKLLVVYATIVVLAHWSTAESNA